MENNEAIERLNKLENAEADANGMEAGLKKKKLILISILVVVLIILIIIILIFTVFKKDTQSNSEGQNDSDSISELDTITKQEMDKARNSFQQFKYTDSENSSYTLDYNLFIPANYSTNKKYPLIMFIEDGSLVGTDEKIALTNTVGGPIWATETEQKKHESFVLVPQYSDVLIDDNRGYTKSEYINVTYRLIKDLIGNYSIDSNKIYCTGQSMGAMTTLYFLANYPGFLAAGLVVDGQWKIDELSGLINAKFTYFAAGGDEKAFNGQTQVKEFLNSSQMSYGELTDLDAKDEIDKLNNFTKGMYDSKYSYNFITYKKGTVLPANDENANEHMSSFKYGYRIDAVRDWLFEQNKVKCEDGSYYSEDGKCADTNYCKITNNDLSCKECIFGYYLNLVKGGCTKVENCKTGNKSSGECN